MFRIGFEGFGKGGVGEKGVNLGESNRIALMLKSEMPAI
jgi:hypothetical protein